MTRSAPTTVPSSASTITLPVERLEQLRMIADKRGVTLVGLLESVINEALADDEIPDTLPNFDVHADDDVIVIGVRGWVLPMMRRRHALTLAHMLEAAAGKQPLELETGVMMPVGRAVRLGIREGDAFHEINVGRHGRGVAFSFRHGVTDEAMNTGISPSIATDLARLIRKEVATMVVLPPELERQLEAAAATA